MSYYATLQRTVIADQSQGEFTWPAELVLRATLAPAEVFGCAPVDSPNVVLNQQAEATIDSDTGKISAQHTRPLSRLKLDLNSPSCTISFDGNIVTLRTEVKTNAQLNSTMDWLCVSLGQFLSTQIGVFAEVKRIDGSIGGKHLRAMYSGGTYSTLLAFLTDQERDQRVTAAICGVKQDDPSYLRLAIASLYFHHALRLISPHEVNYIPYCAHAEVMLNLTKCIELLLGTAQLDRLRPALQLIGYTKQQIESQIIAIFVVRNELDIAHPTGSRIDPEDVGLYRQYIDRSIVNVGSLLRRVTERIGNGTLTLKGLSESPSPKRDSLKRRLRQFVEEEALEAPGVQRVTVVSGR